MTLATVDPDGRPSARMVLCRGFDARAGWVVFYTDRESLKGQALDLNPRAALVFHWDAQDRKSTRLNSSHVATSYAVFCLKKKNLRVPRRALREEIEATLGGGPSDERQARVRAVDHGHAFDRQLGSGQDLGDGQPLTRTDL